MINQVLMLLDGPIEVAPATDTCNYMTGPSHSIHDQWRNRIETHPLRKYMDQCATLTQWYERSLPGDECLSSRPMCSCVMALSYEKSVIPTYFCYVSFFIIYSWCSSCTRHCNRITRNTHNNMLSNTIIVLMSLNPNSVSYETVINSSPPSAA